MLLRALVVAGAFLALDISPLRADSWQPIGSKAGAVSNVTIHPSDSQIILLAGYLNGANRTYRTVDGGATYSELPFVAFDMFYDPVNPNTVYALAGYIERSTDAGATWTQVSTFYPVSAAVAKSNPNRLYAGEAWSNRMYTSTDGATTWAPVTTFASAATMSAIAVDPTNESVVYAGTYGTWDFGGEGIFKSSNAGSSWTNITPPIFAGNAVGIAIDPSNPLVVYCVTAGGGMYSGNGVLKSINGGTTWVQSGFPNATVDEVVVDALHANRVYALVSNNLYVSNDAGASWTPVTAATGIADIDLMRTNTDVLVAAGSGVLVSHDAGASFTRWGVEPVGLTAVRVDRTNGNNLVATGRFLYRTTDGAVSWELVSNKAVGMAIVQDPANAGILYNGSYTTGGGVEKSLDGGATWSMSLANKWINDIAIASANPLIVYACGLSQPSVRAIFRSADAGASWTTLLSSYSQAIVVHPVNEAIVYAGGADGVSKSLDGGATWTPMNSGLDNPASGTVLDIVIDPNDPETVYAATSKQGVYRSVDGGAQWTRLTSPMTDVRAIEIDPVDAQVVYAATYAQGIFVTADGGHSWTTLGSLIPGRTDITVDPTDRNTLYMAGGGVWKYVRTTPCAVPSIESHEPAVVVLSACGTGCPLTFTVDTADDYSQAAVVALERRSGDAWVQEDQILAPLPAEPWQLSRTFQPSDTPGDYVFRVVIRGVDGARTTSNERTVSVFSAPTGVTPVPTLALALEQNRPNPFNPSTTISFQMPSAAHATLAVYGVNGELVAVLADRTATQGTNYVVWSGRDGSGNPVSSGIYFYRLTTLGQTLTRRMVLLK